jgi:hypothetical protein
VAYDLAANDGDWFPGGDEDGPDAATASPTAAATAEVLPTSEPPATGYELAEEAIGAFLVESGQPYAGDCNTIIPETDIGKYCSDRWESPVYPPIYVVGMAFAEPDTWLLLAYSGDDGWTVVDEARIEPGAPDTPPWP